VAKLEPGGLGPPFFCCTVRRGWGTDTGMSTTPAISVCIPAYDMGGAGGNYLGFSLERLTRQTFEDFEVVVSDQSDGSGVAEACAAYGDRLTIRRVAYREGKRQASANTNNAMRHARGRILKVLFQDDFLCDDSALQQVLEAFQDRGCKWVLTGSAVTRDGETLERPMVPRWQDRIRWGFNTISSPSVLALEAGHDIWFDENLQWLMDGDMYHSCHQAFGAPVILPDTLVANRIHAGQVSAGVSRKLRRQEVVYTARKGGLSHAKGDLRAFFYQYLKALG
jgi:glycosyltransferase involved in cell wall biosynthesis